MNELYWITRLDMINGWLIALSVVSGIVIVTIGLLHLICDFNNEEELTMKRVLKTSMITFFICLLLSILTPTKNEAFMIWGVGSTIDYIQDNETIQQLPDKCVDALNAWVESLNEEEEEKN